MPGSVPPSDDPNLGRFFGSYRVVRLLARGGMGSVYLGEHPVIRARVAIKLLHPEYAQDPSVRKRFVFEAESVNLIGHENVLRILDLRTQVTGEAYCVMEYLEGRSLAQLLAERGRLPLAESGPVALQCCRALAAAHAKGVLHRDVKPDNVFLVHHLGRRHFVKLVDFGIAKLLSIGGEGGPERAIGTPQFMPPEQWLAPAEVGPAADVYALGVTLFQVATGALPFQARTPAELGRLHCEAAPPRPRTLVPSVEPGLEEVILRALEKDPRARFTSMNQLHAALLAVMRQEGIRPGLAVDAGELELASPAPAAPPGAAAPPAREPVPAAPGATTFVPTQPATGAGEAIALRFRPLGRAVPAEGELLVWPESDAGGARRQLATLALSVGAGAFPAGAGPVRVLVLQADPTLDDLLAAAVLRRALSGGGVPRGMKAFAAFAALAREGLQPSAIPLERSIDGVFLALRLPFGELDREEAGRAFAAEWERLEAALLAAAARGADPFAEPLLDAPEFARERVFLADDQRVYQRDARAGERWRVALPGQPGDCSALILRDPRSVLFKQWSRRDAGAPTGDQYLLLGVRRGPGQWIFSTDPVHRAPLAELHALLQAAERTAGADPADPWFDGAPFAHTLVASPRAGTRLADAEVLALVRAWCGAATVAG